MRFSRLPILLAGCMLLTGLTGCGGGADRAALAKQTVNTYWSDIGHLQIDKAYDLLSPGNQQTVTRLSFRQNMIGFLESLEGVSGKATNAQVIGDCALVALTLNAPAAQGSSLHTYQHLYWLGGGWRITEPNGQTTQHPGKLTSCPTGT